MKYQIRVREHARSPLDGTIGAVTTWEQAVEHRTLSDAFTSAIVWALHMLTTEERSIADIWSDKPSEHRIDALVGYERNGSLGTRKLFIEVCEWAS